MPGSSSSYLHNSTSSRSRKRSSTTLDEPRTYNVPSQDSNAWYYPNPSGAFDSDDSDLHGAARSGNWGNKKAKIARWARAGKMVPWGPAMDDWEAEDRARKRLKLLAPPLKPARSPSPPALSHLRSPSPPLTGPYPSPTTQHLSYSSFVLDKSVTQTFRSHLIDDLERATNGFIEAEAAMKKALGRLWQAMSEDPDKLPLGLNGHASSSLIPKREDDEDMEGEETDEQERERQRRMARAPDLTPSTHKIFLFQSKSSPAAVAGLPDHSVSPLDHFAQTSQERQLDLLDKSLASLRHMQDDGREYVERLEEIRDGVGDVRAKRDAVWDIARGKALQELQEAALSMAG